MWDFSYCSRLRESTTLMPLSCRVRSAALKISSGRAVTSSDLALSANIPFLTPKASMLSHRMSACLFWATSW